MFPTTLVFGFLLCLFTVCEAMDQETLMLTVKVLSKQLVHEHLQVVKMRRSGLRNYHAEQHNGMSMAAIYNHANNIRTVGMGEFTAVLNGVEFRSRHNDYRLKAPVQDSTTSHDVVDIPFPEVPPSVTAQETVPEQMEEMRKYFKAFHQQNSTMRQYQSYFKPVLCYLEGAWTTYNEELQDYHLNVDILPIKIVNWTEDGTPVFGQWDYRIVCHQIQHQLNLQDFNIVDDLASRMEIGMTIEEFAKTTMAKFTFAPQHTFAPKDGYGHLKDYVLLDTIMAEILGMDNYPEVSQDYSCVTEYDQTKVPLDGHYHRPLSKQDESLYVAATNKNQTAATLESVCVQDTEGGTTCQECIVRYSYAIPLEIIWLTPLHKWNPYNINHHEDSDSHIVTNGGRNGEFEPDKAFDGTSSDKYYRIPANFFSNGEPGKDLDPVAVLDQSGGVRNVTGSGIRVFTPHIEGVGRVRLRYPIYTVHP